MIPCPDCRGLGWVASSDPMVWPTPCETCDGRAELGPRRAARVYRASVGALSRLLHITTMPDYAIGGPCRTPFPETCARVLDRIPAEAIRRWATS